MKLSHEFESILSSEPNEVEEREERKKNLLERISRISKEFGSDGLSLFQLVRNALKEGLTDEEVFNAINDSEEEKKE